MSKLVQCTLRSGTRRLVTWLEPKVKEGDLVTLKDSDNPLRKWSVVSVGPQHDKTEINRGWNNNI